MSIAKNSKDTLVRQIISIAIQFATIVIVARNLGVENNGMYAVAILLPTMLTMLLSMSINSSIVYYVNSGTFSNKGIFTNTFVILLFIVAVGLGIGYAVITFFASSVFPNVSQDILHLSIWVFPFSFLRLYLTSFLLAKENFKIYNIASLISPILLFLFIMSLYVFNNLDVKSTILSNLLTAVLASLVISYYVFKEGFSIDLGTINGEWMKKLFSYGIRAHVSNMITFVNYRADIFLLNIFASTTSVGLYQVGVQIVERLWIVSSVLNTVLFPRLVAIDKEEDKRFEIIGKSFKIVILLTALVSLALVIFGYMFIKLFFGVEYINAYFIILALLLGVVLGAGSKVLATAIASKGKPELNAYTSFIAMILNIILNVILIPKFGYMGAAVATSIAYVANTIMRIALYKKVEKNFSLSRLKFGMDDIRFLKQKIKSIV